MAGKLPDDFLKDLEELSDDEQTPSGQKAEEAKELQIGLGDQIEEISKLKSDINYQKFLDDITEDLNTIQPADKFINLEKADPIYELVKKGNTYMMEIEHEINILHKEVRDIYQAKFSELESIIYDAIEYTKCIKKIGDEKDLTKVEFSGILSNQTIMNITVAASMNKSNELPPKQFIKLMYY